MVIILVHLFIELQHVSLVNDKDLGQAYQIEDGHLHHTLIEVGSSVFDNFDSHNFLCSEILTFDDLSEGTLTENVENKVSVPGN